MWPHSALQTPLMMGDDAAAGQLDPPPSRAGAWFDAFIDSACQNLPNEALWALTAFFLAVLLVMLLVAWQARKQAAPALSG